MAKYGQTKITISKVVKKYSDSILQTSTKTLIDILEYGAEKLRNYPIDFNELTFHVGETGREYLDGWDWKEISSSSGNSYTFKGVVYNTSHYSLAHFLENGHLTRDGKTRTRKFPHIKPTRNAMEDKLESELVKKLESVE